MGDIYANAHVTLAASSVDSVHKHILGPRDAKRRGVGFQISGAGSVSCRRPTLPWDTSGGEVGPIARRAWTMQERILSSRVLTYTDAAMILECLTCSVFECQIPQTEGMTQLGAHERIIDKTGRRSWAGIQPESSRREQAASQRSLRWQERCDLIRMEVRCWSMGRNSATGSLLDSPGLSRAPLLQTQNKYIAPSWSWASVDGR
jgi:hypothetical protein